VEKTSLSSSCTSRTSSEPVNSSNISFFAGLRIFLRFFVVGYPARFCACRGADKGEPDSDEERNKFFHAKDSAVLVAYARTRAAPLVRTSARGYQDIRGLQKDNQSNASASATPKLFESASDPLRASRYGAAEPRGENLLEMPETSFVISNMLTWLLPLKTGRIASLALICVLFFLSCSPFFLDVIPKFFREFGAG